MSRGVVDGSEYRRFLTGSQRRERRYGRDRYKSVVSLSASGLLKLVSYDWANEMTDVGKRKNEIELRMWFLVVQNR